jgi:hypothetical protein
MSASAHPVSSLPRAISGNNLRVWAAHLPFHPVCFLLDAKAEDESTGKHAAKRARCMLRTEKYEIWDSHSGEFIRLFFWIMK